MKIIYRVGDAFTTESFFILHGCNAKGVQKSGFAKTVVERYPSAYMAYRNAFDKHGLQMGEIVAASATDVKTGQSRVIINAITQQNYGRDPSVQYVSYDAVKAAIDKSNYEVQQRGLNITEHPEYFVNGLPSVTMPLVGAGLANGDWGMIAEIIEETSVNFQPIVYVQTQADLDAALQKVALVQMTRDGEKLGLYSDALRDKQAGENKLWDTTSGDGLESK